MDPAGVQTRRALPHPATAARVAWLERFYELVFVAVVAVTAQRPAPRLACARCGAAVAMAAVTAAAIVGGKLPGRTFSAALAALIVAAAAVDGLLRYRMRAPQPRDPQATPGAQEAGGALRGGADAGIAGPSGIIAFAQPALVPRRAWRRPRVKSPRAKDAR